MPDGIDLKRIINLDPETTVTDDDYTIVDSANGGAKKFALGQALNDLKSELSDALSPTSGARNLVTSAPELSKIYIAWNDNDSVVKSDNASYGCTRIDVEGLSYISTNINFVGPSYSFFGSSDEKRIGKIVDYQVPGTNYVYTVPANAKYAYFSQNITGDYGTLLSNYGLVVLSVNTPITDTATYNSDNYPYGASGVSYYADDLKLKNEYGKTISELVTALKFISKKNLALGLNEGQYAVAWNIGDTVSISTGANYAYVIADVEGCEYVTVNMNSMSDAYSFFTDASHKKVATSADNRVGTSRVYSVPSGAKYFYISTSDIPAWSAYGIVVFNGSEDIASTPANAEVFGYRTPKYFSDNLELLGGLTLGEISESANKVYHVEKDGSGDFDNLVEAIQTAVKYMNSVVYVGAGTWDIVDEFGSEYMEAVTSNSSTWGLVLKNNIHVIGTAKTLITAIYEGDTDNTKQYFSVFNAGEHGFTLENLAIEADNIRYVMHDDRGNGGQAPYTNRYINVSMKLTHGYWGDTALGGGLGVNGTFEIINCRFEGGAGTHRLAYYHGNNYGGETGAKCKIIVQGCYFADVGSFDMTNYGDSLEISTAYLSNNSFGSAPEVTNGSYAPRDTVAIVAWNNEIRSS